MAYTLLSVATRAQKRARDTGFDITEAKAFVNDTQNAVANEYILRLWEQNPAQSYTLTPNVADITNGGGLPSDFVTATSLLLTTAGKQRKLDFVKFEDLIADIPSYASQSANVPNCAYVLGSTIYVYPKPDSAYTLELWYQKRPAQLSGDADVPQIPSEFEELLIYGAVYRMFEEKDMEDKAALNERKYQTELVKLTNRYGMRTTGGALYLKQPRQRYAARDGY